MREFLERRPGRLQRALRGVEPARLAEQEAQPQSACAATPLPEGVARRPSPWAVEQGLVVVGGEEEAAALAVLETREQQLGS